MSNQNVEKPICWPRGVEGQGVMMIILICDLFLFYTRWEKIGKVDFSFHMSVQKKSILCSKLTF